MLSRILHRLKAFISPLLPAQFRRFLSRLWEVVYVNSPFSIRLQREIPEKFKIGMAVLAYERPHYLEDCLDTLFQTKLYDYDVTFLLQDDGSSDPRVRDILNRERNPQYKIIRYFTEKGHHSAGAAINKAMKRLMEMEDFDIIGWCDPDTIHHPDWLDRLMKVAIWAKRNHKFNIIGPFSAFHSSDRSHRTLGSYNSPYGGYEIKDRVGMANYFYFTKDFIKLGFFEEEMNEETIMMNKFAKLKVRNLCLTNSYVEHIGINSSLKCEGRINIAVNYPERFVRSPHGQNMPSAGWPQSLNQFETLGYYKYVKRSLTFGIDTLSSSTELDVAIPVAPKDLDVVKLTIKSVRKYLKHPIRQIYVIAPESEQVKSLCLELHCVFLPETEICSIQPQEINFRCNGYERSKWLYQQFLKLSVDELPGFDQIFLIDADTILTSPQVFERDGKTTFFHADEYHYPYFVHLKRLLDIESIQLSFVAHQALISKRRLIELKHLIETIHGCRWTNAILSCMNESTASPFSEFETYGHWMLTNYPETMRREYWFHKSMYRSQLKQARKLLERGSPSYRSISLHSYS